MAEIGRADRVLVVLSDKYLRSPNCMRELLHLFQRSQGDRTDLMGRVVTVILGDLKIDRATGRAEYIRHWRDEHKALESVFQDRGGPTWMAGADPHPQPLSRQRCMDRGHR